MSAETLPPMDASVTRREVLEVTVTALVTLGCALVVMAVIGLAGLAIIDYTMAALVGSPARVGGPYFRLGFLGVTGLTNLAAALAVHYAGGLISGEVTTDA